MKHYTLYILLFSLLVSITSCGGSTVEMTEEEVLLSEELKAKFQGADL